MSQPTSSAHAPGSHFPLTNGRTPFWVGVVAPAMILLLAGLFAWWLERRWRTARTTTGASTRSNKGKPADAVAIVLDEEALPAYELPQVKLPYYATQGPVAGGQNDTLGDVLPASAGAEGAASFGEWVDWTSHKWKKH